MKTKCCSRCKEVKPVDRFHKDKNSKDGLVYYCKDCAIEKARQWAKANPKRRKEISSRWAEKNKEKRRTQNKQQHKAKKKKSVKPKNGTGHNTYWRPEEDEIIRQLYPTTHKDIIGKMLGRTGDAVALRATQYLGVYKFKSSPPQNGKLCIKCNQVKSFDEFGKDSQRPDGLFPYCKRCRLRDPEKYDEIQENESKGLYHCSFCDQWFPPENFYPNPTKRNGLHNYCKPCTCADAKRYALENSEKIKTRQKKRYWNNRERERKRYRRWSRTSRGKFVIRRILQKRRKLSELVPNTLTHEEWIAILELQDYTCLGCGRKFDDNLKPTMDHIVPLSKGGGLTKENVQALCRPCNSRKSDKVLDLRKSKPKWGKPKRIYQQLKLF